MINAILIDDEAHCLSTLQILLKEYCPDVQVRDQCRSAREGIAAIKKFNPDLVFLDIEMPAGNGFEMLEQFSPVSFAVIFATSYDQYAIKAIRFRALDYLLKPVDPQELIAAIEKVKFQKKLPADEQFKMLFNEITHKQTGFKKIAVPTFDGYELIPSENVLRCEANDNYANIFLKNNVKIVACWSLKEMEEQLQDFPCFIRVHHSYIINLNEAAKYVRGEGGYLIMNDGITVNVSRSRKELSLKYF